MNKKDCKEAKKFVWYMIEYHNYGHIDFDGGRWHIYTPNSYFQITSHNDKFIIWRESDDGKFYKQEYLDSLTFALFRCYFRDFCKDNNLKANEKLYNSFYQQFNSYLILKAIERLEIE